MIKPTSWLRFWVFLFACLASQIFADTITLTDGKKVEGKIIEETPENVRVEFPVSQGVYDQITVPRLAIKNIEKEAPDSADFHAIKTLKSGPNWLRAEENDAVIAQLKSFIQRYPTSTYAAEVQKALGEFEKERARVVGGDLKFHGKWHTSEQFAAQRDEIQGEALYDAMKDLSARGDLVGALNWFDALERQASGTHIYPDAVELAQRVIAGLQPIVERRIGALKAEMESRKTDIKTMGEQQRTELTEALKLDEMRFDRVLTEAEQARLKWVPLQPRHMKSLEKLKTTIQAEKTRLLALSVVKMRGSIELANTAASELAAHKLSGAESDLKRALADWPQNGFALRLGKEIEEQKAAAVKAALVTPVPTLASASPTPSKNATKPTPSKPAASPKPSTDDSEGLSLPVMGLIGAGVIAVLAGGAALYNRSKAKKRGQS